MFDIRVCLLTRNSFGTFGKKLFPKCPSTGCQHSLARRGPYQIFFNNDNLSLFKVSFCKPFSTNT